MEGAYNLLDYPAKNINAQILKSKEELDKIQALCFIREIKCLSPNDGLAKVYAGANTERRWKKALKYLVQMREIE